MPTTTLAHQVALPLPNYNLVVSTQINALVDLWHQAAPTHNRLLQYAYLQTLEQFPPKGMSFQYAVLTHNNQPVGVLYYQLFKLNLEDSLQSNEDKEKSNCIITALSNAAKKWLLKRAEFHLLVGGNLLLTGRYGVYLGAINDPTLDAQLIHHSNEAIQKAINQKGHKVRAQLLKDYPTEANETLKNQLEQQQYYPFAMQPCMYVPIRPYWNNFDDYLADMSSKYRVRVRRARKKGKALVQKELSLTEIEAQEERLYELYKGIADSAGFNAFLLHPHYFSALKRGLGEYFQLKAYYLEGKLVAFRTLIHNHHELDAHFLGVDGAYNREHQVYLNILYDLVQDAITAKVHRLDFARTALEIKSSVGAIPEEMTCFFKHQNTLSSKLIQLVFDSFNPKEEWQPRNPFKQSQAVKVGGE